MARDPYRYFRIEARELHEQMSRGVLELEQEPGPLVVARILRHAHTLKGAARVVKQADIATRAHAIEEALEAFRNSTEGLPEVSINFLLQQLEGISRELAALSVPAEAEPEKQATLPPQDLSLRANVAEMDALLEDVSEAYAKIAVLRRSLGELDRARQLAEDLSSSGRGGEQVAGELRSALASLERTLGGGVEQLDRELRQVRDATERLRLVRAETLFTSIHLATRDAATRLGRQVTFQGSGGEIRLDAHALEAVQAAMTHAVRNAVAHGIEPAEERSAAGKPAQGKVTLGVARRGREVVFSCQDDGRGVDLQAVRRAAQRQGLSPSEIDLMGSEGLLDLLLQGGMSTAATVTQLAGRGIGLDVVREAARQLKGKARFYTEAGRSTTLELRFPMSLASLDVLLVESEGIVSMLPLSSVLQAVRLGPTAAVVMSTVEGDSLLYQDSAVPYLILAEALGSHASSSQPGSAVIVQASGGRLAVGVDRLQGTANAVLHRIPDLVPRCPLIAGAAFNAEGNPRLVLDPEGLLARARQINHRHPEHAPSGGQSVLIVDDSLTTRMLEQSILESAGYRVDLASSAEEGLEMARAQRYDLFLVDVEMPGMDGFGFIETIRRDELLKEVPALLVSSRSFPEDVARGREVGAQGYIIKSEFDQKDLLARIRKLLE